MQLQLLCLVHLLLQFFYVTSTTTSYSISGTYPSTLDNVFCFFFRFFFLAATYIFKISIYIKW